MAILQYADENKSPEKFIYQSRHRIDQKGTKTHVSGLPGKCPIYPMSSKLDFRTKILKVRVNHSVMSNPL